MNANRLLSHFERISDAPDAVDRLRRFILDLAVRGKLVEQDPRDEPAGVLLDRIAAKKMESSSRVKTRTTAVTEADPYLVPPSWAWTQIADLGLLSPRNDADKSLVCSFVPMSLISAAYGVDSSHEKRPWGEIKKGYTHIADGDVAVAKITPCFENGKSTVFRNLTGGLGAGTTELHVVRPIEVNPDYIVLFLKSPFFIENGIPRMTGTAGQKRLPGDYFAYRPFPLPPLAEQHRIVAKVDELMKLCDRLESSQKERESRRDRLVVASLNRLGQPTDPDEFKKDAGFQLSNLNRLSTKPEHIKEIRKAILNLAVRGKLVEQDEREGTAAEVLDAIKRERQDLIDREEVRREKPVAPIAVSEIPFSIPSTWAWSRIANIVLFTQYGTSQKGMAGKAGVPVLAMGNIQDGKVLLGKAKTIPAASEELPGLYLRQCDLLYNRTNSAELVGKTGLFLGEDNRYTFASYLIRLRPSLTATAPSFLNCVMSSPVFRETQIVPHIKKQTGQANVNGTALRNMLIPLPPLAEQKRIVAKVDELMLICDQLETQLESQQKGRGQLLEALLHEALEGVG